MLKIWYRRALRGIFRGLFRLLTRLEVSGIENIPKEGGFIFSTNHLSVIDPPLVFAWLERDDATSLVAKKHQKNTFYRWLLNSVDGIWINRQEADFKALRTARKYLEEGGVLGIAPEGTRSSTGALIEGKTGVAYLADKANVPILPSAITGTDGAVPKILRLQRPRITFQVGELLYLPPLGRNDRDAALRRNTDELMCRIAAMLPERYRGVYQDHPRLQELLASEEITQREGKERLAVQA